MTINERLRAVRGRSGLTLQQVSERTSIGVSSLSELENGLREPSLSQLGSLANCYHLAVSSFFEDVKTEGVLLWRSRPKSPASNGIGARFFELVQQYHNLEMWCNEKKHPELPVGAGIPENLRGHQIENLAGIVQEQLKLGNRPGATLLRVLEEVCGVKIFHDDFDEHCAACTVDENLGAAVLLNRNAIRSQINFDLAHELFHLVTWKSFKHDQASDDTVMAEAQEEDLANIFARNLLMPRAAILNAMTPYFAKGVRLTFDDVFDVARQFDVGVEQLILRLDDVYGFPKEAAKELIARYTETAKERHLAATRLEEKDTIPLRPLRFRALAFKALHTGEMSEGLFAKYLGVNRKEAMELIEHNMQQEPDVNEEVELTAA
jgi:Zn-dependent peptidase ImmA (M78 family)/transcriptional regulator with XRE-family HTH domain